MVLRSAILNIARSPQYQSWFKLGIAFLTGQGILQALQLITGILIVRTMPVEQYAQYTLAFAMQSTALMLVEGGFAGSIIGLVGARVDNKEVIGNYVKTAAFYRNRLLWIVGILFSVVFFFITERYEWDWHVRFLLLLSILLSLIFSAYINLYKPVLQVYKKFSLIYRTEIYQALFRLSLVVILFLSIGLIAWQLALLSTFVLVFRGLSLRESARKLVLEPQIASSEAKLEMFQYVKPLFPGIIFAAFQGQITILIISFFGNVQAIAEVGALGRLSQLFFIFNSASMMLLVPYFARQPEHGLLKKYLSILAFVVLIMSLTIAWVYFYPESLLWIIGKQYTGLSSELLIVVTTSSIGIIDGAILNINKSRRWVYWWMPWLWIPGIIVIQILFVLNTDISSTFNVLLMGLGVAFFSLLTRLNVSFWGFRTMIKEKVIDI